MTIDDNGVRSKLEQDLVRPSFTSSITLLLSLISTVIMASAVAGPSTKPIHPFYCGVCSLPTEYCEFGPSISKCKSWLEGKDKTEYQRVWGGMSWPLSCSLANRADSS
jgi:hypothetical protein